MELDGVHAEEAEAYRLRNAGCQETASVVGKVVHGCIIHNVICGGHYTNHKFGVVLILRYLNQMKFALFENRMTCG